jgi:hypothetical protein
MGRGHFREGRSHSEREERMKELVKGRRAACKVACWTPIRGGSDDENELEQQSYCVGVVVLLAVHKA